MSTASRYLARASTAAILFASFSAFSQTPPTSGNKMSGAPGAPAPMNASTPSKLDLAFDRMDANKDGQISRDEFKAAKEKRQARHAKRMTKSKANN